MTTETDGTIGPLMGPVAGARTPPPARGPLTFQRVVRTWWPLAGSWILMALELPAISAIMARLAEPRISLAAYGGIVFPLALIIEAPIIMLLAASTALAKDQQSYRLLRRFMLWSGAGLTAIHLLVALTPLYDLVVDRLIGAPEEIRGAGRIGLIIMTPWTWAIAYRRLQQGVLIRFGRSYQVGIGTIVRLLANVTVLAIGYRIGTLPGIAVGTAAVATGVTAEAGYAWFIVRPVLRHDLPATSPKIPPLTFRKFLHFYVPLAMTSLLNFLTLPIGSAAISRMPRALDSLAAWPVITGLTFTLRCLGLAFNEVVVALLDEPMAARNLRRFALLLSVATSLVLLSVAVSPLASIYFGVVSGLSAPLALLAKHGLWFAILLPFLGVHQNLHQGVLVHSHRTRAITEAVVVYILTSTAFLSIGILHQRITGLYVALAAAVLGNVCQVLWLWMRSRSTIDTLLRSEPGPGLPAAPYAGNAGGTEGPALRPAPDGLDPGR